MKKSIAVRIAGLAMAGLLMTLSACGSNADAGKGAEPAAAENADAGKGAESSAAENTESTEEGATTTIANPWVDITEAEANEIIPKLFVVPEGATDPVWRKCESLGDTKKNISPMVQLNFDKDGLSFVARAQTGLDEKADISGYYGDWTVGPEDTTLSTWGSGQMSAKTYRSITDEEYYDQITWYDVEIGISYCLSVSAKDLDGFDIQAVAESMAPGEEFMPGSFVEEAAGKETFDSYDELISYLKKDNGYTYFKLEGYDGDLLAVTEQTYDDLNGHKASMEATFYGDINGKVKFIGNAFSSGTAYPVRCDGTLIYSAGNHEYTSQFMNKDGDALIVKDYISENFDENGNAEYSGFHREDNTYDSEDIPSDPAEAEKILAAFYDDLENKEVMNFTVVGE